MTIRKYTKGMEVPVGSYICVETKILDYLCSVPYQVKSEAPASVIVASPDFPECKGTRKMKEGIVFVCDTLAEAEHCYAVAKDHYRFLVAVKQSAKQQADDYLHRILHNTTFQVALVEEEL